MSVQLYLNAFADKNKSEKIHDRINDALCFRDEIVYRTEILQIPDLVPNANEYKTIYTTNLFEAKESAKIKDKGYTHFAIYLALNYVLGVPAVVSYVDRIYASVEHKYVATTKFLAENQDKFPAAPYKYYQQQDTIAYNHFNEFLAKEKEVEANAVIKNVDVSYELFKKCVIVAYKFILYSYSIEKSITLSTTTPSQRYAAYLDCNPEELKVVPALIDTCMKLPVKRASASATKKAPTPKKRQPIQAATSLVNDDFDVDEVPL